MKALFIFTLSYCLVGISLAQDVIPKTEMLILGTIHTGNVHFNHRDIYKAIEQFSPDMILEESSNDFKKVFGLRTANFLGIWKSPIEDRAFQKFRLKYPKVPILAYDTSFDRRSYLKGIDTLHAVFFRDIYSATLSKEDSIRIKEYSDRMNMYYRTIEYKDLCAINQPYIYLRAEEMSKLDNEMVAIGERHINDKASFKAFKLDADFWIKRNDYMIRKIKAYIDYFRPKRLMVVTGLNHKYYLRNGLSDLPQVKLVEMDCK